MQIIRSATILFLLSAAYPVLAQQQAAPEMCGSENVCTGPDAGRLETAYKSSVTTDSQRTKILEIISLNKKGDSVDWSKAASDYFAWRQGPPTASNPTATISISKDTKPKDFRAQLEGLPFPQLLNFDPSSLDKKLLKNYTEVRRCREYAVNTSYSSVACVESNAYQTAKCSTSLGVIDSANCSTDGPCWIVFNLRFENCSLGDVQRAMRGVLLAQRIAPSSGSFNPQFCSLKSASGGNRDLPIRLTMKEANGDVKEMRDYSGKVTGFYRDIYEVYEVALPIEYVQGSPQEQGTSSNSVTIRFSGNFSTSHSISADQIYGTWKKLKETNPSFLRGRLK